MSVFRSSRVTAATSGLGLLTFQLHRNEAAFLGRTSNILTITGAATGQKDEVRPSVTHIPEG